MKKEPLKELENNIEDLLEEKNEEDNSIETKEHITIEEKDNNYKAQIIEEKNEIKDA